MTFRLAAPLLNRTRGNSDDSTDHLRNTLGQSVVLTLIQFVQHKFRSYSSKSEFDATVLSRSGLYGVHCI